ncbi:MAG: DUF1538 domain-containing protein [Firmicutes bacterium]|nr:DUF1538 domain-containing protein [Candidatus Fiminaster equi]
MRQALLKLKDSLLSTLPVLVVVLVLYFAKVANFESNQLWVFGISVVFVIIGMWLFNMGSETSMSRMGELIGSSITKKRSMAMLVIIFFLFGAFITMAEPDLSVLADQVPIDSTVLTVSIGVGVGIFLVIGAIRILLQKPLTLWLLAFYGLMFALCCLVDYAYVPLSLDSGGVTTGPITVPFILSIGLGLAASRSGKKTDADSFGLVAFSSIGPILVVLILSIFLKNQALVYEYSAPTNPDNVFVPFWHALGGMNGTLMKVATSLVPIVVLFLIYELIFIKLSARKLLSLFIGVVLVYVGLVFFLTAVDAGFLPVGKIMGQEIAQSGNKIILVVVGAVLGIVAVFAEPAVHVLTDQIETVSNGSVKKLAVLFSIAIGNGVAIAIAMMRTFMGFSLFYVVVPGYFIAFLLSFFVKPIYTAIAFDSGGVVSGPMNSTFIQPFAIGACFIFAGANSSTEIMKNAFGTIAIVALMPLIMIQLLGLTGTVKEKYRMSVARKRIADAYDDQIIHF